ncbi:hypothetical protein EV122DRAFT_225420 [Schizophyllum commune]
MKAHYATAPKLDLKNRDREVRKTVRELFPGSHEESPWPQEPLKQQDLLEDLVGIITGWFSDIWRTVHEIKADFHHVHECLLWAIVTSSKIVAMSAPSSPVHHMPIAVPIESKGGQQIRLFEVIGLLDIRIAVYWLWKELFLNMFTVHVQRAQVVTPIMFSEIEDTMGLPALQKILTSENATLHEDHWPAREQYHLFRDTLSSHLTKQFCVKPSVELYHTAISISSDASDMKVKLQSILRGVAITSRDILVAVLSIYIDTDHPQLIAELLRRHRHVLRVDDFVHLQSAVSALARHDLFLADALTILSQELRSTVTSIQMTVHATFVHVSDPAQQAALAGILRLRPGSQTRRYRIKQWVIAASGADVQHPDSSTTITDLPSGPFIGDATTADAMDLINPDVSRLVDIAPYLGNCLSGWVTLASSIRGGERRLQAAYGGIVREMEFFKAPDIVDAMISHMSAHPTRTPVCSGLQQLSRFCKAHRTAAITKQRGWTKREVMKSESVALRLCQ